MAVLDGGWLSDLTDAVGVVHGWIVTLESITLNEEPIGVARYDLTYSVWKVLDCDTGDDTANSEDLGSAEREAVITAFADSSVLTGHLGNAGPLQFARLGLRWVGSKCVHIDEGSITVEWRPICQ